ncbi:MAG TPA: phage holin family protein [Gemmatimonadaceae bacterium]|jgi:uncharacterized membrane protein YqjE
MAAPRIPTDPDIGIPDLVRRLGDDSKRLVVGEVRLAKMEVGDTVKRAGHGLLWLAVAFGIGVIAMVALTLVLITLIGRLAAGHMWIGALVTGAIELAIGIVLLKRGMTVFKEPSYSLEQTREGLQDALSS